MLDACGGERDPAARRLAGSIHSAAVVDLVGPLQPHNPACRSQRIGLNRPGVVDHRPLQLARRHRGHQHPAALGLDQLLVLHQGLDRGRVDLDVDQLAVAELQPGPVARRQCHGAVAGLDRPFVAHRRPDQRDIAAVGRGDAALVDHLAGRAVAGELVVAPLKVGVGNLHRGRHHAAHVHLRVLAEQHARRVDQEHLAVGGQLALDDGGVVLHHPVQRHGTGVGLLEFDLRRRADVEGVPVQRRLLGGLVDLHLARRLGDRRRADGDRPAGGQFVQARRGHGRAGKGQVQA